MKSTNISAHRDGNHDCSKEDLSETLNVLVESVAGDVKKMVTLSKPKVMTAATIGNSSTTTSSFSCSSLVSTWYTDWLHRIVTCFQSDTRVTLQLPQRPESWLYRSLYFVHQGKVVQAKHDENNDHQQYQIYLDHFWNSLTQYPHLILRARLVGGMDRQNRVGSKFGGGGVSSAQQAERERKERLKALALESIDLAKDPYLVRNHLGSYECKLCLTLHRDEANYLAHTQGKKHQAGLARRAHLDKLKREREAGEGGAGGNLAAGSSSRTSTAPTKRVKIGRPAYQVFKSRDPETNQRCLSFELQYPDIEQGLQPRHRFMSAFEQKVESPPDRRYQYLLFAAAPYETVAFKIPNETIDKGEGRFVTFWDDEEKKFIVTLYFVEQEQEGNEDKQAGTKVSTTTTK